MLACSEALFIIDIIAEESLDKQRQSLLELATPGRHCLHYLWLLTQSYSEIPKNLRRHLVWYPKARSDLKRIYDENNVLTDDELIIVRGLLKQSKHTCLYIWNENPDRFRYLKQITKVPKQQEAAHKGMVKIQISWNKVF